MDACQNSVDVLAELEMMLIACDICSNPATDSDPVGTNCGHLFCWSCLNEAFRGQQARPCPVCRTDIQEQTAHNFPIHAYGGSVAGSMGSATGTAGHTSSSVDLASSDISIPTRPTPSSPARTSVSPSPPLPAGVPPMWRSNARMEVVQDRLDERRERNHALQLDMSRRLSELRGERIRQLEQVVDTLVQMNYALLRQVQERDQRIAVLEEGIHFHSDQEDTTTE